MIPQPPTSTLFPYTTLFRSGFDQTRIDAGREDHRIRAVLPQQRQEHRRHPVFSGEATHLDRQAPMFLRSEEHTSELQSRLHLVCRLLLEKKKKKKYTCIMTT